MKGLNNFYFHKLLNEREAVFLYASDISVNILKRLQPQIAYKLKPLPLETPCLVQVKDKCLGVTLIRAGHCPGSVMFLFEIDGKVILYTGDFRIHKNDFKKFKCFKYPSGASKHFNKIYLDTTFFSKNYPYFPPRDSTLEKVCCIIHDWIEQSTNHIVHILTNAKYGCEFLYIEISKRLQLPIHVGEKEYNLYKCIPEMDKAVTLSEKSTQLHSNCGARFNTMCLPKMHRYLVKRVHFFARGWTECELEKNGDLAIEHNIVRVCYSTHASLEEGTALIRTLKPDAVEPCVVPSDRKEKEELMKLIDKVVGEYKYNRKNACDADVKSFVINNEIEVSASQNEVEFCGVLASPPRKSRRQFTK